MSYGLKAVLGMGIIVIIGARLSGQGVVTQRNLSLPMAKAIAEATIAECKAKGFNLCSKAGIAKVSHLLK